MRPEELIAGIYGQIQQQRASGKEPRAVVMSLDHFRLIEWYRNFIGETEDSASDYLGEYEIFGLEILIERREQPLVR